jgi:hypothetical protein
MICVIAEIVILPSDLHGEFGERFILIVNIESAIRFVLNIPFFGFSAHSQEFFLVLIIEGIVFKIMIFCLE